MVYPNPYRGDTHKDNQVTLSRLPSQATLRLYTLDGRLVRSIDKNDMFNYVNWDLANNRGRAVASGVYLYIIKSGNAVRKGKIVVLR